MSDMVRVPTIRFITLYDELITHHLKYGIFKRASSLKSLQQHEESLQQHEENLQQHEENLQLAKAPEPTSDLVSFTSENPVNFEVSNLRDFSSDKHRTVDSRPYGGIDGMVLRVDVLARAVEQHPQDYVISSSPRAEQYFSQRHAYQLLEILRDRDLCFVCGRFSGFDQRFEDNFIHASYSLGDFIASGGELPCLMIAEAVLRLYPGVLGSPQSYQDDSFAHNYEPGHLEHPLYTKPRTFRGQSVPAELLSGDHKTIEKWKKKTSSTKTLRSKER